MTKVNINKRLEMIAFKIPDNRSVIDVGCDHALLGIYLVLNKKNIKVIASDINEGPLVKARENIKKYKVEEQVKVKLGNGIDTIEEGIDTIVISGMGGLNMVGILKYKTHLLKNVSTIVLSPNNYTKEVRQEITKLGYHIVDEDLVEDKGIIYPVIVFEKGKRFYRKQDYIYGPILLKQRSTLFKKYLERELLTKQTILKSMPKKYIERRIVLKKDIKRLEKLLNNLYD